MNKRVCVCKYPMLLRSLNSVLSQYGVIRNHITFYSRGRMTFKTPKRSERIKERLHYFYAYVEKSEALVQRAVQLDYATK
jgi:hypothetical protein